MKLNFDATTVTPAGTYELTARRGALVTIARVEIKPTKKGDGQYLEVEMDIQSDEHRGAQAIPDRLNLWNPNPQRWRLRSGSFPRSVTPRRLQVRTPTSWSARR